MGGGKVKLEEVAMRSTPVEQEPITGGGRAGRGQWRAGRSDVKPEEVAMQEA